MTVGNRPRHALLAALVLLAGAFMLLPALDLTLPGRIMHWHVEQPGFVHGGIELLVLATVLAWLLGRSGRWPTIAALAVAWLYLRRHHVDLPLAFALLHLELLVAAGVGLLRLSGQPPRRSLAALDRPFLVGIIAWTLVALALSALGWGRPDDLRLLAIIALVPVLVAGRSTPVPLRGWRALRRLHGGERMLAVAIVTVLLGWLARSNNILGYDALWYGLRPEQVLAPERSFFDVTGLVSPAFYFPKLYELLIAPLSAYRDVSYPYAFGVLMLAMVGVVVCRFTRRLGVDRRLALAGTLAIMTIPALANTAVSPKPDVLAALLVIMACAWSWRAVRQRDLGAVVWMLAAVGLASAVKLGTPPFALATLIGLSLALVCSRRRRPWRRPELSAWLVLLGAAIATCGIHFRTWWLTGMPTVGPDTLVGLWQGLGFRFREPIGTLQWLRPVDWNGLPALVHEILFAPGRLLHIVVSWTGNIWLWLGLAGGAFLVAAVPSGLRFPPGSRTVVALLTPQLLAGLAITLGVGHMTRGGDGNYLIVALVVAMLSGLHLASRTGRFLPGARALVTAVLVATALGQFAYSLAGSHWGEPGTRRLDLEFGRSTFDSPGMRRARLAAGGLEEVADVLARAGGGLHVVGYVEPSADGYLLPARFEHLASISYSRPEYVADAASFHRFLALACVEGLIAPTGAAEIARMHPGPAGLLPLLRADPAVLGHRFARYELLLARDPVPCD